MKICDRCHNEDARQSLAVEQIVFKSTDEKKDLCQSCLVDVREFISCKPAELKQVETGEHFDASYGGFSRIQEGG